MSSTLGWWALLRTGTRGLSDLRVHDGWEPLGPSDPSHGTTPRVRGTNERTGVEGPGPDPYETSSPGTGKPSTRHNRP